jgi:hypothetical protein
MKYKYLVIFYQLNNSFTYFSFLSDSQSIHSDSISTKPKKKKTTSKTKKVSLKKIKKRTSTSFLLRKKIIQQPI